jgi:hypothetical protein
MNEADASNRARRALEIIDKRPREQRRSSRSVDGTSHNGERARPEDAVAASVSEIVTVIVGHRLGKAEAVRRLKEGFARTHGQLGPLIALEQDTWEGDTGRFRMRALGQTALVNIEVLDDALRIDVTLPWLLAKAAKRLLPVLRKEASMLLEKK